MPETDQFRIIRDFVAAGTCVSDLYCVDYMKNRCAIAVDILAVQHISRASRCSATISEGRVFPQERSSKTEETLMAKVEASVNHARQVLPETSTTQHDREAIVDQVLTITTMIGVMLGSIAGVVLGAAAGTEYPGATIILGMVLGAVPSVLLGLFAIVPLCLTVSAHATGNDTPTEYVISPEEIGGIRHAAHH
jgi:hypothetical protein